MQGDGEADRVFMRFDWLIAAILSGLMLVVQAGSASSQTTAPAEVSQPQSPSAADSQSNPAPAAPAGPPAQPAAAEPLATPAIAAAEEKLAAA